LQEQLKTTLIEQKSSEYVYWKRSHKTTSWRSGRQSKCF
jgi:hypothetical protein